MRVAEADQMCLLHGKQLQVLPAYVEIGIVNYSFITRVYLCFMQGTSKRSSAVFVIIVHSLSTKFILILGDIDF